MVLRAVLVGNALARLEATTVTAATVRTLGITSASSALVFLAHLAVGAVRGRLTTTGNSIAAAGVTSLALAAVVVVAALLALLVDAELALFALGVLVAVWVFRVGATGQQQDGAAQCGDHWIKRAQRSLLLKTGFTA
jgi:hypothetical protein